MVADQFLAHPVVERVSRMKLLSHISHILSRVAYVSQLLRAKGMMAMASVEGMLREHNGSFPERLILFICFPGLIAIIFQFRKTLFRYIQL